MEGVYFNPRSPHGERPYRSNLRVSSIYFNPRSPHGERLSWGRTFNCMGYFNPRSPHGERRCPMIQATVVAHFNPRSPHGERQSTANCSCVDVPISIHAPRTGSDIHSTTGGVQMDNFNPRSPHGERRYCRFTFRNGEVISIHAPRTGSDRFRGGAHLTAWGISIHAPRTGSDRTVPRCLFLPQIHFNPRSPHGERLRKVTILSIRIIGFAQKVYHKTVLLRISLAENAVILPEKPRNPVRTSLQKAGGLRFARAIRAARPYSISSPSGA